MIGFTFNNVHSRYMGVVFKSDDRTLLPAKRITQYKIPGKSGTYDIADGYDNRVAPPAGARVDIFKIFQKQFRIQ